MRGLWGIGKASCRHRRLCWSSLLRSTSSAGKFGFKPKVDNLHFTFSPLVSLFLMYTRQILNDDSTMKNFEDLCRASAACTKHNEGAGKWTQCFFCEPQKYFSVGKQVRSLFSILFMLPPWTGTAELLQSFSMTWQSAKVIEGLYYVTSYEL